MASPVDSTFHPSPPSPDNGSTVIVLVFISFGSIFFVALCFFALYCFMKKRNKCCLFKKKKTVEETDVIHMDEHRRVKEAIVEGPNGKESIVLSIEDDKHIEEKISFNEKMEKEQKVVAQSGEINAIGDLETGESSSKPASVHHTLHHLVHKP